MDYGFFITLYAFGWRRLDYVNDYSTLEHVAIVIILFFSSLGCTVYWSDVNIFQKGRIQVNRKRDCKKLATFLT